MKKTSTQTELVIFKGSKGQVKLRGDFRNDTLWATLDQIAEVFQRDKSVISRHLKNIFSDGELDKNSVVAKNATTAADGKTYQVEYFNLDAIISVGYRVNSTVATKFRQWATSVLKSHITDGFTINRARIATNYADFMKAVELVRALAPKQSNVDTESVLELVQLFADTWFSLDAYDKEALAPGKITIKKVKLTADEFLQCVQVLKTELVRKGEASENFAQERNREAVEGIIGNVMQSFGGNELYPTVEEKAAHLMYFVIKNHPFVDGNKRTGAYALVWFLQKMKVLDTNRLTPTALTALTLLVAESNPADKEKVVALVVLLIAGPGANKRRSTK
jgi:prophage maintenance system killer protein/predicted transcriptional regulator